MVKGLGVRLDLPSSRGAEPEASCWSGLPPELLRDILKRVEQSEDEWPRRKSVVACAGVCSTWREVTRDIVAGPEFTGKVTFPVSLKQVKPLVKIELHFLCLLQKTSSLKSGPEFTGKVNFPASLKQVKAL